MEGFVAAGIGALLALVLFGRGLLLQLAEHRRQGRLQPAPARVTRQTSERSVFVSEDANGERTERLVTEYVATYTYRVGNRDYEGQAVGPAPPFRPDQVSAREITVYYDSADPAVSRVSLSSPDNTGSYYMVFAGVVFAVGIAIAVISGLA